MDKMGANPQIILIDGPAGSGKTTLALKLVEQLRESSTCELIHLDYVYNGWDDALSEYLTNTLGDLLKAFLAGANFQLPIYDWRAGEFNSFRTIYPAENLIIEGVGAGQSAIRSFASQFYWVEAPDEIGLQRVLERDGMDIADQMRRWKLREAEHFAAERTRDFADFIISTT